jgi:hypothetical protein
MVLVSHKYKFIFFKTRKTAGTSIECALGGLCVPPHLTEQARQHSTPQLVTDQGIVGRRLHGERVNDRRRWENHKSAADVKRDLGDTRFKEYFKFTVVRNPWDKVVSLHKWRTQTGGTDLPFDKFVARCVQYSDDWPIISINNKPVCNFHIRFENLEKDFRKALQLIGLEAEMIEQIVKDMPHHKSSVPSNIVAPETRPEALTRPATHAELNKGIRNAIQEKEARQKKARLQAKRRHQLKTKREHEERQRAKHLKRLSLSFTAPKRLPKPAAPPHFKKTPTPAPAPPPQTKPNRKKSGRTYRGYYDASTREQVATVYKKEVDLFNYRF